MEEVLILLEDFFDKTGKSYTKSEIKKSLKLKGEDNDKFLDKALNTLVEDGKLFYENNCYKIFPKQAGFAFGELQVNQSGTGFVHTNDGHTILIEHIDLNGALNGDNVIVSNIMNKRKDYYHGEIYKVTKRKKENVVFSVIGNGKSATIMPYNSLEYINIDIDPNELKNCIDGDLVLVKLPLNSIDGVYKGTIIKHIGHKDDPDIDIKVIYEEHMIPIEFSKEALEEADSLPKEVTEEDIKDRVDLRSETIFTIDCDDTKDRDDSIGIKKLDNGNYLLKVNISHVSYYIKDNSKLYQEALMRTTSHYAGNTCNPMFPHIISNGICSLNPNLDRLTRTVEMEIDRKGNIVNYSIYTSVINSKCAMTYSNVNRVLEGEKVEEYEPFKNELKLLEELNVILERSKCERNYINFNTSEVQITNKDGRYEFKPNTHGLAGKIIENCMLLANTTVYSDYSWNVLAYRVHEEPNFDTVKNLIKQLRISGIKLPNISDTDIKSIKKVIDSLDDSETSQIVREYLLKSMKKARYDTNNLGHFALQYDTYGHFTSPIRRIIDFMTHKTIDKIEIASYDPEEIKKYESFLNDLCDRTNKIERESIKIEEEVEDMIMAKEMSNHIGEEFEVYITDINNHSMMARTKNLVRGKIKIENMYDDNYYYDSDKNAIIGRNSKKKYQLGNKAIVLIKDASKEARTVYFEIPKQKTLKM